MDQLEWSFARTRDKAALDALRASCGEPETADGPLGFARAVDAKITEIGAVRAVLHPGALVDYEKAAWENTKDEPVDLMEEPPTALAPVRTGYMRRIGGGPHAEAVADELAPERTAYLVDGTAKLIEGPTVLEARETPRGLRIDFYDHHRFVPGKGAAVQY